MTLIEFQVDRLVGPTHHFGGLGVGNLASHESAGRPSSPAAAAIQGLDKMRRVAQFTGAQLILPPQPRPAFAFLRRLGFQGTDADVLKRAYQCDPVLLSAATSCSAMWTANAATVTPAVDSEADNSAKAHVTIANLVASVHRAIEPAVTETELRGLFGSTCEFNTPIPGGWAMRDEGAANHMRLGTDECQPGINLFVHGDSEPNPKDHLSRQSRAASETIARLHRLRPDDVFFLKQHPDAIDAGAFHNDVVAMSHHNLLIHHEHAFWEDDATWNRVEGRYRQQSNADVIRISVGTESLTLEDAVRTYLFNSQIVSPPPDSPGKPRILCTRQVESHEAAHRLVRSWCDAGLFESVEFVDLDQSMSGGGGPACLRLRVPLAAEQHRSIRREAFWSESLDEQLREAVQQHYVTNLSLKDLARIEFHEHAQQAYQAVLKLLGPER